MNKKSEKNALMTLLLTHYGESGVRFYYGLEFVNMALGWGLVLFFICMVAVVLPALVMSKTSTVFNFILILGINILMVYTLKRFLQRICDFVEAEILREVGSLERQSEDVNAQG